MVPNQTNQKNLNIKNLTNMKKTTFIFTMATFFVMASSYSQSGNTINDPIPLDGNSITADLLNLGPANNSGLLPQCKVSADIFFKHTVSAGDNKFVYGMGTLSVAATSGTVNYQLFKAPNGDISNLEEITCDNYNIIALVGGSFEDMIEYVIPGDDYYFRLFKPTGIAGPLLVDLADISTVYMLSSYDSTLSVGTVGQNAFKVVVRNNSIQLYNNLNYKDFSVFAIDGRRVMSQNSNENIETIDISMLDRGLYILMFQNDGDFNTQKFIKH